MNVDASDCDEPGLCNEKGDPGCEEYSVEMDKRRESGRAKQYLQIITAVKAYEDGDRRHNRHSCEKATLTLPA